MIHMKMKLCVLSAFLASVSAQARDRRCDAVDCQPYGCSDPWCMKQCAAGTAYDKSVGCCGKCVSQRSTTPPPSPWGPSPPNDGQVLSNTFIRAPVYMYTYILSELCARRNYPPPPPSCPLVTRSGGTITSAVATIRKLCCNKGGSSDGNHRRNLQSGCQLTMCSKECSNVFLSAYTGAGPWLGLN